MSRPPLLFKEGKVVRKENWPKFKPTHTKLNCYSYAPPMVSESAVLSKVTRRLIPFMFLLYIVSYLDRINVGFAALQLNKELQFDPAVFGLGAEFSSSVTSSLKYRAISSWSGSAPAFGSLGF